MKAKKKKVFSVLMTAVTLISCMSVCTACGKAQDSADNTHIEGELQDILTEIYAGADIDSEAKEAIEGYIMDVITEENEQALLGTSEVTYVEGIFSVPMISPIPYQCVLLRVNPEDVDSVKELLTANADLNKWVCTSAETALVENVGDLVLFVMCEQTIADALSDSFQSLGKQAIVKFFSYDQTRGFKGQVCNLI